MCDTSINMFLGSKNPFPGLFCKFDGKLTKWGPKLPFLGQNLVKNHIFQSIISTTYENDVQMQSRRLNRQEKVVLGGFYYNLIM